MPVPPPPGQPFGELSWKPDYTAPTAQRAGFLVLPSNRNPPAYVKNGVYCADTVPGTGTISFAAQALGTGYGAVDPRNS